MDAPIIATAADALAIAESHFRRAEDAEILLVLYLDLTRRLLGISRHEGGPETVDLPLRAIAADALRLDARGLIVAHNHPSGQARPSEQDVVATGRLADAMRPFEIRLHDHLILAGSDCASFAGLGLL